MTTTFLHVANPAMQDRLDEIAWGAGVASSVVAVYFAIFGGLNWIIYRAIRKRTENDDNI